MEFSSCKAIYKERWECELKSVLSCEMFTLLSSIVSGSGGGGAVYAKFR